MNYDINYDDQKFQTVEAEKQAALDNVNNTYDNMINSTDQYYQDQINAAKDYANTQQKVQQDNTDFTINQINQQKEQAGKDYTKEQAGSYQDWQKQSNQYGANAEQQAAQGLTNTGYSESSQVSMYNQYQNRVGMARDSFNRAVLNYDNSIKEAQLANNAKLAEIAYQALQTQLQLSLEGFQYKNTLLQTQIDQQNQTEDRYYSRWKDVLIQMNQENQFAENIRQYEQNYTLQQEQLAEEKRQYEQNYTLQVKQFDEDIRQFNEQIERLKAQDEKDNAYKIQQLELQKQQLAEQKRQADQDYKVKQQQLAQSQAQWQAEYNLAKSSSSGSSISKSSGGSSISNSSSSGTKSQVNTQYYSGALNPDTKNGVFNTTDKNGVKYQPNNVGGKKLSNSGLTINNNGVTQKIWKTDKGNYYYWEGRQNKYISIPANTVKALQKVKNSSGGGSR